MIPGEVVLLLEEEGAGKLQPHPRQLRPVDQDVPQGCDGAVQQRFPLGLVLPRLGRADRRHAGEEQDVDPVRVVGIQSAENAEGLFVLAQGEERPRLLHCRVGREMGIGNGGTGNAEEGREEQRTQQ